jgi:hypothetical protein
MQGEIFMKRFWLFMICAALAPSLANAECSASGCALVRVVQVYIEANGNLYIQTNGDETRTNCVPDSGVNLFLSGNATKFREVYELMLLSFREGKTLNIRIVEGSNPCEIAWVAMTTT